MSNCLQCGVTLPKGRPKFCTRYHGVLWHVRQNYLDSKKEKIKTPKVCKTCGVSFHVTIKQSLARKHCDECLKPKPKDRKCVICGAEVGIHNRRRKLCSKACAYEQHKIKAATCAKKKYVRVSKGYCLKCGEALPLGKSKYCSKEHYPSYKKTRPQVQSPV